MLHSVGDIVVLARWWATGRPEWQLAATPPPLVWDSGVDASFAMAAAASIVLALATAWAYRRVRRYRVTG